MPLPRMGRRRGHVGLARSAAMLMLSGVLFLLSVSWPMPASAMRGDHIAELRRETVSMFYHGYDNYMRVAFPEDELRPVSCMPLTRDPKNPSNIALNDVLGNYSLTLIDSLSTLAILASAPSEDGDVGPKALRDFQDGVAALVQQYGDGQSGPSGRGQRGRGFDVDSKVQVFETVIRGVGGLLSAHLFAVGELPMTGYAPAVDPATQEAVPWPNGLRYDGQLLRLALDLATRLLPAFYSPTGMPYPRVNLRHGIPFYHNSPLHGSGDDGMDGVDDEDRWGDRRLRTGEEITETCSAGAGSLVLEFTVLSRLTGDQRFEQLAKRAFWAVWYRRSHIGLIGAGVDAEQGRWIGPYSVIGAGADSFFEYALKSHILLSGHELPNRTQLQPRPTAAGVNSLAWIDPNAMFPRLSEEEDSPDAFLEAWNLAHAAIKRHLYSDREHPHYVSVNIWTGSLASQWIDSLGAYYSGLLALAGELEEAVETNLLYTAVWTKYAALPERWSLRDKTVEGGLGWWPLRPEFIESTYHIYRATKDPWYLYVGEMVQRDIRRRCWTHCGWAGLQNVLSGEKTDRMESFFLGETAKYMYLLYDDRHPLNSLDAAYVFTTEGHPLIIPKPVGGDTSWKRKGVHKMETAAAAAAAEAAQASSSSSDLGRYDGNEFRSTCPLPPKPQPLTGSAVAARPDIFHASRLLDLHLESDNSRFLGNSRTNRQTLFPRTMPPSMLPQNGTCAKVQQPLEMSLEFSITAQDHTSGRGGSSGSNAGSGYSAFNFMIGTPSLDRITNDKIRVLSISGMKLLFRLDGERAERTWRVTRVNGVPLGRDESIVIDRALLGHISDTRFSLVRDPVIVKLHHLHHVEWEDEEVEGEGEDDDEAAGLEDEDSPIVVVEEAPLQVQPQPQPQQATGIATLVRTLWQQIVAVPSGGRRRKGGVGGAIGGVGSGAIGALGAIDGWPVNVVVNATGVTPTGLGAAPLPPVDTPAGATIPAAGPVSTELLPWTRVYAGGYGCDGPLPETAARDHQVLVLRRGGCSFSEKLANVPAFVPHGSDGGNIGRSLQLVVVVSDDEDIHAGGAGQGTFYADADDFVRPLLDEAQRTPRGLARRQQLAMVMVGGGEEAYAQIAGAQQLGLTRRYMVESQGVRIRNILIDDGDEGE